MLSDVTDPAVAARDRDQACAAMVIHLTALAFRMPAQDVAWARRGQTAAVHARHAAMYLMHVVLDLPLARVGAAFARDRSTVSFACKRVEDLREEPDFDRRLSVLERCLSGLPTLFSRDAEARP